MPPRCARRLETQASPARAGRWCAAGCSRRRPAPFRQAPRRPHARPIYRAAGVAAPTRRPTGQPRPSLRHHPTAAVAPLDRWSPQRADAATQGTAPTAGLPLPAGHPPQATPAESSGPAEAVACPRRRPRPSAQPRLRQLGTRRVGWPLTVAGPSVTPPVRACRSAVAAEIRPWPGRAPRLQTSLGRKAHGRGGGLPFPTKPSVAPAPPCRRRQCPKNNG